MPRLRKQACFKSNETHRLYMASSPALFPPPGPGHRRNRSTSLHLSTKPLQLFENEALLHALSGKLKLKLLQSGLLQTSSTGKSFSPQRDGFPLRGLYVLASGPYRCRCRRSRNSLWQKGRSYISHTNPPLILHFQFNIIIDSGTGRTVGTMMTREEDTIGGG